MEPIGNENGQISDISSRLCLEHRAEVNAEDYKGWTALHRARLHHNLDHAVILLANGAGP